MAAVIGNNQVKLDNGKTISAQEGGWYDGQQYFGGSLGSAGVINNPNAVGYGQAVSSEVNRASSVAQGKAPNAIDDYLATKRGNAGSSGQVTPSGVVPSGATSSGGTGVPGGIPGGVPGTPTINLPELYKSLTEGTGVKEKQNQLSQYEKAFADAQSKINDNPFLSEANRVGRVQKLQTDYNQNTAGIRNDIATAKADVETQINLQTKQYDINSQQSKDALDYFDRLLASGGLNNASNEDIANLTRATGLSSGIISSAIANNKQAGLKTSTTSFDDGTNEGILVYSVDQNGNVVGQQRIVTGTSSKSAGNSEDAAFEKFLQGFSAGGGEAGQSASTGFNNVDQLISEGKYDQAVELFNNP